MDSVLQRHAKLVNWSEIRKDVYSVNQELAQIIDEVSPDNSYKFVLAEYLYGDIMVNTGTANLPTPQGGLAPINNDSIDKTIKKELSYKLLPLALILDKTSETFLSKGFHAIPLNTFHPGMLCGTYEMMDYYLGNLPSQYNCWNFSVGSRSIIMLPKITDSAGLRRLSAEYCISTPFSVKELDDHWLLFKLIAQSKIFPHVWKNKVVFFGKKWLDDKNDSPAWRKFRDYLIKQAWIQALYVISKSGFSFAWGKYAEAIISRKLRPPIHLLDQLKHILAINKGIYAALQPSDDEQMAPVKGIKEAFVNIYMLKEYLPTIMMAKEYSSKDSPAYYSLSHPTMQEGSSLKKDSATIMLDLHKIRFLMNTLEEFTKLDSTDEILANSNFEYFHVDKDKSNIIRPSDKIALEDKRFLIDQKRYPDRKFCSSSQFFKGCIRISLK